MSIKVKLQIYLVLLASLLMFLGVLFEDITFGKLWFYVNGNSLVGIQSFSESASDSYKYGIFFYDLVMILLSLNLFCLSGVFSILVSLILFLFLGP